MADLERATNFRDDRVFGSTRTTEANELRKQENDERKSKTTTEQDTRFPGASGAIRNYPTT